MRIPPANTSPDNEFVNSVYLNCNKLRSTILRCCCRENIPNIYQDSDLGKVEFDNVLLISRAMSTRISLSTYHLPGKNVATAPDIADRFAGHKSYLILAVYNTKF